MPNRLSKIFKSSDKEKEALAQAEAQRNNGSSSGSSTPPAPAYDSPTTPPDYGGDASVDPPEYDADNAMEPPDYTAGFRNLNISDAPSEELPQVSETIAHLKILECFYRLRQKIGSIDGLFGIQNQRVLDLSPSEEQTPQLLAKLAEKRWACYVSRAVDRFQKWSFAAAPSDGKPDMAKIETEGTFGRLVQPGYPKRPMQCFQRENMPPPDVLMVWHAYMLNPRAYLEDCIRYGKMSLWNMRMPWQAAVDCINAETFEFEAGQAAETFFTSLTGQPWDNLTDAPKKEVKCWHCATTTAVPWTNCASHSMKYYSKLDEAVDSMLASGTGFCDRDFKADCFSCGTELSHTTLQAGKFCNDLKSLLAHDTPMAGTILGLRGFPFRVGNATENAWKLVFKRTHAFLSKGLGQKILEQTRLRGKGANESLDGLRDTMEQVINFDKKYMRRSRAAASHKMTRMEKIAFRKMMSRYWDNSSPFALDLVGAVIRQGSFIEKMHGIDWLHSPALPSTMKRLITKYARFLHLMATTEQMAVPTLDVDLAWHTHQLNPSGYLHYTVANNRQFIDHDDKVAETKLNTQFEWTSKTYHKLFKEPYSECTCWYCEAVRESHTSTASKIFNTGPKLHNPEELPQDPSKSVHISSHNAVRPTDTTGAYTLESRAQAAKLEAAYTKACERAEKKGGKPPRRDDYYYSSAYGYPVFIPAYAPFVYMPYTPIYYPVTPGCMAAGSGVAGGCAAGTCGGGVAAGACASGAGCAGGAAAGGCGGGGIGGGGGCGGGGGGGGCGGGGGGC